MISPAVAVIARFEWQRRWRGLVALALITGLFGGAIIAGTAVARRTASAPRRLLERVHPGDAHLQTIGDVGLAEVIAELPSVSGLWASRLSVAKVDGDTVVYIGVIAEQQLAAHRTMPFAPVVVAGRMYDDSAVDEIVLREDSAAALDIGVDDTLSMSFLTPEEIGQFDTGFGEPDGPTVTLRVVGLVRVPSGVMDGSPAIASPAFAAAHPEIGSGNDMFVELVGGSGAVAAFTAAVDEIVATRNRGAGSEDFPPVQIDDPGAGTARLEDSSRILIGGLLAALIVAVIAALVVCGQAWSRHFAASATQQQVESALGLDTRVRLGARLVPAVAAAAVGAGIAATVGLTGSAIQPLAGLGRVEPDRGWRVDGFAITAGASAILVSAVVLAALAVVRAGRRHDGSSPRRVVGQRRFVPRRGGWPLVGAAFARSSGATQQSVPVTVSLAASVLGVGGLVGALIFSATLHRLTDTPARYGWRGDVAILDVNDDIVAELVGDPRVASVADVVSSTIRLGSLDINVYAFTSAGDELTWSIHRGRLPVADNEVMIGSRLAQDLDVDVGDSVEVTGRSVTVAGIGLGPPLNGEPLGSAMLFSPEGIRRAAAVGSVPRGVGAPGARRIGA